MPLSSCTPLVVCLCSYSAAGCASVSLCLKCCCLTASTWQCTSLCVTLCGSVCHCASMNIYVAVWRCARAPAGMVATEAVLGQAMFCSFVTFSSAVRNPLNAAVSLRRSPESTWQPIVSRSTVPLAGRQRHCRQTAGERHSETAAI